MRLEADARERGPGVSLGAGVGVACNTPLLGPTTTRGGGLTASSTTASSSSGRPGGLDMPREEDPRERGPGVSSGAGFGVACNTPLLAPTTTRGGGRPPTPQSANQRAKHGTHSHRERTTCHGQGGYIQPAGGRRRPTQPTWGEAQRRSAPEWRDRTTWLRPGPARSGQGQPPGARPGPRRGGRRAPTRDTPASSR
jgi:hypothetical protein